MLFQCRLLNLLYGTGLLILNVVWLPAANCLNSNYAISYFLLLITYKVRTNFLNLTLINIRRTEISYDVLISHTLFEIHLSFFFSLEFCTCIWILSKRLTFADFLTQYVQQNIRKIDQLLPCVLSKPVYWHRIMLVF